MTVTKGGSWPRYSVIVVIGFIFAYLVGAMLRWIYTDDVVLHRTAGGILELLGIGTVALGISELRRSFGLTGTAAEILSEWLRYIKELWARVTTLFCRRRDVTVAVGSAAMTMGAATMRGHGTAGPGPNATLEQRVKILEQQFAQVSRSIFDLEGKVQEEIVHRKSALEAERQARKSGFEDLERQLKHLAIGGIRLQTVGVIWLIAGVFLATWAQEIAPWFRT